MLLRSTEHNSSKGETGKTLSNTKMIKPSVCDSNLSLSSKELSVRLAEPMELDGSVEFDEFGERYASKLKEIVSFYDYKFRDIEELYVESLATLEDSFIDKFSAIHKDFKTYLSNPVYQIKEASNQVEYSNDTEPIKVIQNEETKVSSIRYFFLPFRMVYSAFSFTISLILLILKAPAFLFAVGSWMIIVFMIYVLFFIFVTLQQYENPVLHWVFEYLSEHYK
jgi:hypothetical protein